MNGHTEEEGKADALQSRKKSKLTNALSSVFGDVQNARKNINSKKGIIVGRYKERSLLVYIKEINTHEHQKKIKLLLKHVSKEK